MKKLVLLAAPVVFLVSCSASPPIQRYSESKSHFSDGVPLMSHNYPDKDIYRVFEQGSSGFVSPSAVKGWAEERAEQFCSRQGKGMVELGSKTWPPFPIPTQFPCAEVVFAVVDK